MYLARPAEGWSPPSSRPRAGSLQPGICGIEAKRNAKSPSLEQICRSMRPHGPSLKSKTEASQKRLERQHWIPGSKTSTHSCPHSGKPQLNLLFEGSSEQPNMQSVSTKYWLCHDDANAELVVLEVSRPHRFSGQQLHSAHGDASQTAVKLSSTTLNPKHSTQAAGSSTLGWAQLMIAALSSAHPALGSTLPMLTSFSASSRTCAQCTNLV